MSDLGEYQRVVNSARIELEAAGNPAYGIVVADAEGNAVEPMVYAALRPAMQHAERIARSSAPGERVMIVSRARDGERIAFTIMDPRTRKLHQQFEVVEKSISEEDTLM
ncbi:MAG: hypothetical protein V9E83_06195 [Baekduia sp.]